MHRALVASMAAAATAVALGSTALADTASLAPPAVTPPSAAAPLAPLEGEWLESFDSLGAVSPPTGSTERRPVVVAVHGMWDRPEWACAEWRAVFGPRPFIVCPRGLPKGGGFAWRSAAQIRAAIDALLAAADARYQGHMDLAHRVYVGFSQGAILGSRLVRDDARTYPYVVLQEGLGVVGEPAFNAAFKRNGGVRVLLGCSQGGCRSPREPLRASLARAGIDARVNDAGPQGHTMNEKVLASIRRDVPWLLAGDPAWAAVAADAAR